MVTSSLTHPFYFLLLLHALQPLFPHFTPPHEAITSGSHQGFLMGWLHSLFSPVRKLLVRAHSARRNRKIYRLLIYSYSWCCCADHYFFVALYTEKEWALFLFLVALLGTADIVVLGVLLGREGDAHPVQRCQVLPGRRCTCPVVHPGRLAPSPGHGEAEALGFLQGLDGSHDGV